MKLTDIEFENLCYKRKMSSNNLYQRLLNLRQLFIEIGFDVSEYMYWGHLNVAIRGLETGTISLVDRTRAYKLIHTYGSQSYFRVQWIKTREERKMYQERICYTIRKGKEYLKTTKGFSAKYRKMFLMRFMRDGRKHIRQLYSVPLTRKQKRYLWKAERMLGIFYEDIPLVENGLVLMKEKERS